MHPINVNLIYKRRLTLTILVRLMVAVLVLIGIQVRVQSEGSLASMWPVRVLMATVVLSGIYFFILKKGWADAFLVRFAVVQTCLDGICAGIIVYLTGGVHSWLFLLQFLPVIEAGMLISGISTIIFASLGIIALAISAFVYNELWDYDPREFAFTVEMPDIASLELTADERAGLENSVFGIWNAALSGLDRHPGESTGDPRIEGRPPAISSELADEVKGHIDDAIRRWLGILSNQATNSQVARKVNVGDEELAKRAPPLVDVVPWLKELESQLPLSGMDRVLTVSIQSIALIVVSFLVYFFTLRGREELLADILHRIRDGVLVFDRSYRLLFCNLEARRVLGFPHAAALEGIRADRLEGSASSEPLLGLIRDCLAGARRSPLLWPETGVPRREGEPVLEVHVVQVEGKSRVEATVVWFNDVSERLRAVSAERRLDRLKTTSFMAAGLAHEVRNPLAAIRSSAQQLQADLSAADQAAAGRLFELLIRECDRLDRIVGNFLKFAKQSRPTLARFQLANLVRETVELLPTVDSKSGVDIRTQISADLEVRGDPDQLKQVLLNLGRNALDAMHGSGGHLTISARPSSEHSGRVHVCVTDTGVGIGEEERESIGTPFFTTKEHGTGLGVAIAMKIIAEHGGKLEFEQGTEGGTVVSFDLDRAVPGSTERRL